MPSKTEPEDVTSETEATEEAVTPEPTIKEAHALTYNHETGAFE